ncbi:MAG: heme d1 biosynthesis radical SAM protein NirJ [Alphaproteobacteria bacterium]|nr:heme d1 biosynthesis radical SAM protein NirJ [Alphaproteobacteria bacterium]
MFRLSHYLRELEAPPPSGPVRRPPGPVVIWNLIRRCNLTCKHCYSISGDVDFAGELSSAEVYAVMADLRAFAVPVLILSGGEPLMRPDIFEISARAKALGFYVGLSSNGTLIDAAMADRIRDAGYDYVGVSLDGIGATHDAFRHCAGAYERALNAMRRLRDRAVKVGLRFTMTEANAAELPLLLDLVEQEGFAKFYLSHLVYAGRGNKNRGEDAMWQTTRATMDQVIDRAWNWVRQGRDIEVVTGNNDADAVYLWLRILREAPHAAEALRARLLRWGGNASGVNVANIDNVGNVHPDTMWWHHSIGNVRNRPFSEIWSDRSDPIMAGLKAQPRRISGRCGACAHFAICNGNTRVRALRITGDPWAEDPGCYLSDEEIGLVQPMERVTTRAFRGVRYEAPLSH